MFSSAFAGDYTDLEEKISGLTCDGILAGEPLKAPARDSNLSKKAAGGKYRKDLAAHQAAVARLEDARKQELHEWQQYTSDLIVHENLDESVVKAAVLLQEKGVELFKKAVSLDQLAAIKGELLNRGQEIRKASAIERGDSERSLRSLIALAPADFPPFPDDLDEKMDADLTLKNFVRDEVDFIRGLLRTERNAISPKVAASVRKGITVRLQNDWRALSYEQPAAARLASIRRAFIPLKDSDAFKDIVPEKSIKPLELSDREAIAGDALEKSDIELMLLQAGLNLMPLPNEPSKELRDAYNRRLKARQSYVAYLVFRWPTLLASDIPKTEGEKIKASIQQRLQQAGESPVAKQIIEEYQLHADAQVEPWFIFWWVHYVTLNPIHVVLPSASRAILAYDQSIGTTTGRFLPPVELPVETKALLDDVNAQFDPPN